jgi:succinoglycan biosynthesis transport protein ExoP
MSADSSNFLPIVPPEAQAPTNAEAEGTLELGRVVSALRRRVLLIAAITTAVAGLAGVRARLTPPEYSAAFEILIQPPSGEADVISSVTGITAPQLALADLSLEDQIKILTSPGILAPVVDQVMAENLDLCDFAPMVEADAALPADGVPVDVKELCYKAIVNRLNIRLTETDASQPSRIFQTQFGGSSPQEVRRIATLLSNRFLDYGLESRQRDIQQGIDFLEGKLPDVRAQVDSLQRELEALRQSNNLITPEARGGQLASQMNTYESEYLNVLVELEETLSLYDGLQQQLLTQVQDEAVSPVLSQNQRYQTLVQQLLTLDNEIATASTLFLESSPDMQALREQRQNLLRLLAREAANAQQELRLQLEGLAQREAALSNTLDALNLEVDSLAGVTRQFTDLERELTITTENLNQLLARRELLQIEAAQQELPWELIAPPFLETRHTSLVRNVGLGLVLGLLLGVGVALALDAQKDVLYTSDDLKRVTPVPILGLIPYNSMVEKGYDQTHLLSLFHPRGANADAPQQLSNGAVPVDAMHSFQEAFRSLAANLQRVNAAQPLKSLIISSVDDDPADSTTATYLAWAAAAMGNRVLLVDANFRFPHLHEFLGLPNEKGFSNILARELDTKQVIKRSALESNLFVLTTGTTPTDPARLLAANKIKPFMAKATARFDLIIFDSPSFSDYADAGLLAAEASGLALVSNLGMVRSAQLEATLEKLWISKIPLVGLIAKEAAPKISLLAL